jgi:L-cystine uptake protein TcyP (sodium:dicarboxylate symporter family)
MIDLIIKLDNIRQIALIMYTYNSNDLQIIKKTISFLVLKKYLHIIWVYFLDHLICVFIHPVLY